MKNINPVLYNSNVNAAQVGPSNMVSSGGY